jgi:hypothetical protein
MAILNKKESWLPESELKPSDGRSSKTVTLIAVFSILISLALILFLKQKFWPSVQPGTGQENQKIVIPKVLYNLAGLVQKTEENFFIMEADIPQLDENGKPIQKKEIRKVIITMSTGFSQLKFVAQEGKAGRAPVETPITFKDIKEGDYVEVISNQDISQDKEFEAGRVRSLPKTF